MENVHLPFYVYVYKNVLIKRIAKLRKNSPQLHPSSAVRGLAHHVPPPYLPEKKGPKCAPGGVAYQR